MIARRFTVALERTGKTGTYFEVPFDVREAFGRARQPVKVTIGGHTYRSTTAVYGGRYYLVVNRAVKAATGVDAGDTVDVTLEPDTEPREVDVPDDLARVLADDEAASAAFDALSFSHRREYVDWIEEAKRPDTRRRRLEKTVALVRDGRPLR
jgi:hypothetical protein